MHIYTCDLNMKDSWIKRHPKEWAKIQKRTGKERRGKLKAELIKLLGGKCSNPNCLVVGGCTDSRCLQIDHINRSSPEHKKFRRTSGAEYYLRTILKEIKSGSSNYQLLCANCNWIKRFENKEHGEGGRPKGKVWMGTI